MRVIAIEGDEVGVVMTKDEAQAFIDLAGCVGGCPTASRRRYITAMRHAFYAGGLRSTSAGTPSDIDTEELRKGSIYFKPVKSTK